MRWFIHREEKTLGPFTPEEIREALREGTFDPFDLVSREGSPMRRELVEVDELFVNSKIIYGGGDEPGLGSSEGADSGNRSSDAPVLALADGGGGGDAYGYVPDGGVPGAISLHTHAAGKPADLLAGQGHLALARDTRDTQNSLPAMLGEQKGKRKRRRDPKHFHLMDKSGRVLGPLNAAEIQALFYKGVLDKAVRVMRDGSSAKVPVTRFISLYSLNKQRTAPVQGAHPSLVPGGPPTSFQRMQAGRLAAGASKRIAPAAIIAAVSALVLCIATGWIVHTHRGAWFGRPGALPAPRATVRPSSRRSVKHVGERGPGPALPTDKAPPAVPSASEVPRTSVRAVPQTAATRPPSPAASSRKRADEAKRKQAEQDRLDSLARHKHLEDLQRQHARTAAKQADPAPDAADEVTTPVLTTRPKQAVAAKKAAAKPKAAAGTGVASLTNGQQVVHLGPMTFDKGALASCTGPCNLTFSGAGGSLQVAFFKAVWGPALLQKSAGVYLSGSVRKSGTSVKLVLSNVE